MKSALCQTDCCRNSAWSVSPMSNIASNSKRDYRNERLLHASFAFLTLMSLVGCYLRRCCYWARWHWRGNSAVSSAL